jgi:GNAT superfamily N-acetyltransferase
MEVADSSRDTPLNVTVREATVDDAEGAAAVYVASAEHHHDLDPSFYRVPTMDAVVVRYRERLPESGDDSVLLVAEVDGQIVGTCLVRLLPHPSEASMLHPRLGAEIDVAVLADYRGRGVGQALMTHGENWASERGARLMILNAHVGNVDAVRFYTERLSYQRVGLVLSKELEPVPEREP